MAWGDGERVPEADDLLVFVEDTIGIMITEWAVLIQRDPRQKISQRRV